MLTINNIDKIIGKSYNNWLDIQDVNTFDDYYEFVLISNNGNQQIEYIVLYRDRNKDGLYNMEYNGDFLPLDINEFDTIDKIIMCMQKI